MGSFWPRIHRLVNATGKGALLKCPANNDQYPGTIETCTAGLDFAGRTCALAVRADTISDHPMPRLMIDVAISPLLISQYERRTSVGLRRLGSIIAYQSLSISPLCLSNGDSSGKTAHAMSGGVMKTPPPFTDHAICCVWAPLSGRAGPRIGSSPRGLFWNTVNSPRPSIAEPLVQRPSGTDPSTDVA